MNGFVRGPLVVVAGIPGAGKTTALHQLADAHPESELRVVDSDSVRRVLQARLPGVPYRVLRPVVHVVHWARVVALALTDPRPLLVHETATRAVSRSALLRIARLAGRPARLVWLDIDAETAWRGQVVRNRMIRPGSFRRHLRRVECLDPAAGAGAGWDTVCRTDREHSVAAISAAVAPVPAGR
ncbi:MAG TPA: AAA family ATPase [Kineosporiaceae bacterium]|nr:AAA family ATPase [Kineosporiaceae bacterium]